MRPSQRCAAAALVCVRAVIHNTLYLSSQPTIVVDVRLKRRTNGKASAGANEYERITNGVCRIEFAKLCLFVFVPRSESGCPNTDFKRSAVTVSCSVPVPSYCTAVLLACCCCMLNLPVSLSSQHYHTITLHHRYNYHTYHCRSTNRLTATRNRYSQTQHSRTHILLASLPPTTPHHTTPLHISLVRLFAGPVVCCQPDRSLQQ